MEKGGKKLYELKPGEVFSIDQGMSWVKCTHVYENPEPDGPTDLTITLTSGEQLVMEPYTHVLLPILPGELEQVRMMGY